MASGMVHLPDDFLTLDQKASFLIQTPEGHVRRTYTKLFRRLMEDVGEVSEKEI